MVVGLARRLVEWELLWLLLLAPFLLFPSPSRSLALLGLPLLWGARWLATRRVVPPTPLDLSCLLLLIMVGVSLWVTTDPLASLPKVTGLLLGIALYYALVARSQRDGHLAVALGIVLVAGVAIALLALVGTNWSNKFGSLASVTEALPFLVRRLPGNPGEGLNPNTVASALLFPLPLFFILIWHEWRHGWLGSVRWGRALRIALWLGGGFLLGVLLLTQSRAGYLGLAGGLLALLLLPRSRLALGAGLLGLVLLVSLLLYQPAFLVSYFNTASETNSSGIHSLADRAEIWTRALLVIEHFPWTGVGMGRFREVVPLLFPLHQLPADSDIGHPHNQWLAAATDLGLPGLVAYLALWIGAALLCWQAWRAASPASLERGIALAVAAGLCASFIWGLFDASVLGSKAHHLFWLTLGMLGGLHHVTQEVPDG